MTAELPTRDTTTIVGVDPLTDRFGPMVARLPDTVHWGFALEYSTLYLTNRFTGGPGALVWRNMWQVSAETRRITFETRWRRAQPLLAAIVGRFPP